MTLSNAKFCDLLFLEMCFSNAIRETKPGFAAHLSREGVLCTGSQRAIHSPTKTPVTLGSASSVRLKARCGEIANVTRPAYALACFGPRLCDTKVRSTFASCDDGSDSGRGGRNFRFCDHFLSSVHF